MAFLTAEEERLGPVVSPDAIQQVRARPNHPVQPDRTAAVDRHPVGELRIGPRRIGEADRDPLCPRTFNDGREEPFDLLLGQAIPPCGAGLVPLFEPLGRSKGCSLLLRPAIGSLPALPGEPCCQLRALLLPVLLFLPLVPQRRVGLLRLVSRASSCRRRDSSSASFRLCSSAASRARSSSARAAPQASRARMDFPEVHHSCGARLSTESSSTVPPSTQRTNCPAAPRGSPNSPAGDRS